MNTNAPFHNKEKVDESHYVPEQENEMKTNMTSENSLSDNSDQRNNKIYSPSGNYAYNNRINTKRFKRSLHPSYHQQHLQQPRQQQQVQYPQRSRDELEVQIQGIQKDMHDARQLNNLNAIYSIMKDAMAQDIPLSAKAYVTFLWACSSGTGNDFIADTAFWVLKHMINNGDRAPLEAYELVLKMCANRLLTRDAMKVLKAMKEKFGYISLTAIRTTLPLLCNQKFDLVQDFKSPIPHQHYFRENVTAWIKDLHAEFNLRLSEPLTQSLLLDEKNGNNSSSSGKSWTFEMYEHFVSHFSNRRMLTETLVVLKEMTNAGHSPTFSMNHRLLIISLSLRNVEFTKLLATWFLEGYVVNADDMTDTTTTTTTTTTEMSADNGDGSDDNNNNNNNNNNNKLWKKRAPKNILEYTLLRKILNLALQSRNTQLAAIGMQLFFKFNKVPAPMDYAYCARTYMQTGDILGALDVFFAAEANGVDFLYHYNSSTRSYVPGSATATAESDNQSSSSSSAVPGTTDTAAVASDDPTIASAGISTTTTTEFTPATTSASTADEREKYEKYLARLQQQAVEEENEIEPNRDGKKYGPPGRSFINNNPEPKLLSSSLGLQLQIDLVDCFGASLRRLDEVYYALVDIAGNGRRVPMVVLNALVMALGRLAQRDRAFATFQEFESVFRRVPVLHSYNALLFSIAYDKYPTVHRMLPVMQLMEQNGYSPNSDSFSLLLTVMAETNDLDCFDAIVDHVEEKQLQPTSKSLRRIALAFARQHKWDQVDRVMAILNRAPTSSTDDEDFDRPIPTYFKKRLEYFRHLTKVKNQANIEIISDTSNNSGNNNSGSSSSSSSSDPVNNDRNESDDHHMGESNLNSVHEKSSF